MRPRVVICGSFHKAPEQLQRLFRELETTGCRVLSPLSLYFTPESVPFVKLKTEDDATFKELESFHLRALREADFIFLHAPEGYIGISAAFEIGYAEALRKPVFCRHEVNDYMLKTRVRVVSSVFEALEIINF